MKTPLPRGELEITPAPGVVTITTPGPQPLILDFAPEHAAQIANELDRRALLLYADPAAEVTLYVYAPHFQKVHILHPAHLATSLRRAAGQAGVDEDDLR